jgi:hypothetical protein
LEKKKKKKKTGQKSDTCTVGKAQKKTSLQKNCKDGNI